ncbi:MAG: hypothetical protein HN904_06385 [Victivallales bacterium]|nr:hypothetical protein [Victivallales bacterium]
MQVICGKCKQSIAVEDVDLKRGLAKCTACGELFGCADQLDGMVGESGASRERCEVATPTNITVSCEGDSLRIEYRDTMNWFFFVLAGAASVVIVPSVINYLIGGAPSAPESGADVLRAIAIGVVGLLLGYGSISRLLSRNTILVGDGLIRVMEGPIPVAGSHEIWLPSLKQLYVKPIGDRNRIRNNGISYILCAEVGGRDEVTLTRCFRTQEEAFFLERKIEEFLGIKDRPVRGEVER